MIEYRSTLPSTMVSSGEAGVGMPGPARSVQVRDVWDLHPEFRGLPKDRIRDRHKRIRPLYLRIETVNLCNNDCIICAYGDQTRAKTFMSAAVFEKTVDDYGGMGGGYVSLTPLVGDVLLDRHIRDRIDYLRKCDFISGIGFTTNGAMAHRFNDEELDAIIGPLQRLSISIYGLDAGEYEAMARKKTYTRMVTGLRRIVKAASVPVSLEFRLLKRRSDGFIEAWLRDEVGLKPDDGRTFVNSVVMNYANWGKYDEANRPLPDQAEWFVMQSAPQRPQCLIPLFAFIVFSNGNVSFCPCDNYDDIDEFRLGHVMAESLANMYNSDKAKALWDWSRSGVPRFCQNCSFHIPLSVLADRPSILEDPYQIVGAG
jgi:Radical SAM superfamily/Iron-sulfur cluster-binding domain